MCVLVVKEGCVGCLLGLESCKTCKLVGKDQDHTEMEKQTWAHRSPQLSSSVSPHQGAVLPAWQVLAWHLVLQSRAQLTTEKICAFESHIHVGHKKHFFGGVCWKVQ